MRGGFTGMDRMMADLQRLRRQQPQILKAEVEATGRLIELGAKSDAPVDTGKLRQSITYEPIAGGFGARVTANVPYAAYIEFGTGGLVDIPQGWEEIAGQFKGRGIRQVNLPARPFLAPNFQKQVDDFFKRVEARMQSLTR